MSALPYLAPIISAQVDGSTLTSAAAASCIPASAKAPLRAHFFNAPGKTLLIKARGRISCVVTTPGTARFDVRLGGTVVFDGLAVPLNIVAKTNTGWELEIMLTCRSIGTAGTLMGWGRWCSQAGIGAPGDAVGGAGAFQLPYNTAPAVGNTFDTTVDNVLDLFFTQTVGTGSQTLHQYEVYG